MAAIEISAGATLGENGRYRLRRLLGTGGMASVWLAADDRLERDVAVKVLARAFALDPGYVTRFEREARLAAGLSHPHLVSIYDFSIRAVRPYLVLEYIAGGTLADRLRAPEVPGWDPVVLARELLAAIGYVHRAGIVHRDIKPANVLIGSDGRARLTDFGIAQPSDATSLTTTGLIVGTSRYLAPEVLAGEPATYRSDLFACGVLLGECISAGSTPELIRLIAQLTAEDPNRRPQSAAKAIALLQTAPPVATRRLPRHRRGTLDRPRSTRASPAARVTRDGRRFEIHLTPSAAALAIAVALLVIVLLALTVTAGGTGSPAVQRPASAANLSLSRELAALDRAIGDSRR